MEIFPLVIIFAFLAVLFSGKPDKEPDKELDEEYEVKVYKKKKKKEDKD